MNFPYPLKVLFYFVIFIFIVTLVVKLIIDSSITSFLYWFLPSCFVLYLAYLFFKKGQAQRKNYHSKFEKNGN